MLASGPRQRCTWMRVSLLQPVAASAAGPVPRCQLALTLLLAEAAGGRLATPPQLFDPAFTEARPLGLHSCNICLA
jgi:hypothetical protein